MSAVRHFCLRCRSAAIASIQPRTRLAVSVLACQIGSSTFMTSMVSMSWTGRAPRIGKTLGLLHVASLVRVLVGVAPAGLVRPDAGQHAALQGDGLGRQRCVAALVQGFLPRLGQRHEGRFASPSFRSQPSRVKQNSQDLVRIRLTGG